MKKTLIACFLVILAATSSFGAASSAIVWTNAGLTVVGGNDASVTAPKAIGKLSTGVSMAFTTSTTGYSLITQHKNGVKAFGTSHDSTALYSLTVVKLATTAAVAADSSAFVASWTSM